MIIEPGAEDVYSLKPDLCPHQYTVWGYSRNSKELETRLDRSVTIFPKLNSNFFGGHVCL